MYWGSKLKANYLMVHPEENRFDLMLKHLPFDDSEVRASRYSNDQAAHVKTFFKL